MFSEAAVSHGSTAFLAGQMGLDSSAPAPTLVTGGIVPEAEQALVNMKALLKVAIYSNISFFCFIHSISHNFTHRVLETLSASGNGFGHGGCGEVHRLSK